MELKGMAALASKYRLELETAHIEAPGVNEALILEAQESIRAAILDAYRTGVEHGYLDALETYKTDSDEHHQTAMIALDELRTARDYIDDAVRSLETLE